MQSSVMTRVAAVTMVYNEPVFLPIWTRYYGGQFTRQSCYVVDHGSDDGSTEHVNLPGINVIRIPRSPMHDKKRANFLSNFCSALLEWYDVVIYTDVDEFLIPDPEVSRSLMEFTTGITTGSTITTIGVDVTHLPDIEPPIDLREPILGQRRWARFSFAMCKPLITTVPIRWTPGFHSSDQPLHIERLFLFHLHHFDLPTSIKRLAKTREMPWGDGPPDHYQRWSDQKHEETRRAIAQLPKVTNSTFREDDAVIGPRLEWIKEFVARNPTNKHLFYFQNGIPSNELMNIPDRFLGLV